MHSLVSFQLLPAERGVFFGGAPFFVPEHSAIVLGVNDHERFMDGRHYGC